MDAYGLQTTVFQFTVSFVSDKIREGYALRPRLDIPMFMQRLIPSNLKIALELEPETSDFMLYYHPTVKPSKEYKLMITDISLNVCYCVLNHVPRPHKIRCPFEDHDIVTFSAMKGAYNASSGTVQLKTFPSRILLFFVKSEALNGTQEMNPFVLEPTDLASFTATIDQREYRYAS